MCCIKGFGLRIGIRGPNRKPVASTLVARLWASSSEGTDVVGLVAGPPACGKVIGCL